jgi:hypothetical protein
MSFIYVLSQHKKKGPYKVGMSKGDLWRRMGNYQTVFVNLWVHYLVPVPYADVFTIERFLHDNLSGRVPFPSPNRDRTRLSEWFDCTPRDLRRALLIALAKGPDLNAVGAFRITKDKIHRITMLEQDKGGIVPRSRIGRVLRQRQGHAIYMVTSVVTLKVSTMNICSVPDLGISFGSYGGWAAAYHSGGVLSPARNLRQATARARAPGYYCLPTRYHPHPICPSWITPVAFLRSRATVLIGAAHGSSKGTKKALSAGGAPSANDRLEAPEGRSG